MKLFIKQEILTFADKFAVTDENGNDIYYIKEELFSWGKKLCIYDTNENEIAYIKQKTFSLLLRYSVFVKSVEIAEIVREFNFFTPKYSIEGINWEINGDFFEHDYQIIQNSEVIATISKEWMTWGDCYELDIVNPQNELMALSVVLAIDCVMG